MLAETLPTKAPVKGVRIAYWILTGIFSAMMAFSAYMYLTSPMMVKAFEHLGFPQYFRVELAIAKLFGVLALLLPVPARVKEWAYAGFGITLVSAVIAHTSTDGINTAVMPMAFCVLLAGSYAARLSAEKPH